MGLALPFVADDRLRAILERDVAELEGCLRAEAHKAAMVLSGSIIEAILVDYFIRNPPGGKNPDAILSTDLATLIAEAVKAGVLSESSRDLSTVVRNYRNLIHPGRELRGGTQVSKEAAQVAYNLLIMITREMAETQARAAGYSAEEALGKMTRDPDCTPVLEYIADNMDRRERERLVREIPRHRPQVEVWEEEAVLRCMIKMHTILKSRIPESVVQAEVERTGKVLRTGSRFEILHHLRFFKDDLLRLDPDSRSAVLAYLISIIGEGLEEQIEACRTTCGFELIGRYLEQKSLRLRMKALAKHIWSKPSLSVATAIGEATFMMDAELHKELENWLETQGGHAAEIKKHIGVPF